MEEYAFKTDAPFHTNALSSMCYLFIVIAFYALVVYLIFRVIRFMKEKTALDQQKNEKLDQLIQLLKEREQQS
ncbi:DUF4083 family protein [Brevibacillus nitrificans]|uniref:DUF4083 family protein n=1 Tax=Brevibacillus nitrificans TaxID=651560 RepID=UPI002856BCD1|nr:DUF4083 family protein [Brevibacillus nitrificans]MDR7314395.1 uncharacterized membrane protein (UPF0182 family) [Brevibacillus nitrificans]